MDAVTVRPEGPGDAAVVRAVVDAAFGPKTLRLPAWQDGIRGTLRYPEAFGID